MKMLLEEAPLVLFELPAAVSWKNYSERAVQPDSVSLAVKTWGNPAYPTVVPVHGYPDNNETWHEMASLLARDYYVVAYDVRGTSRSNSPNGMRNYVSTRSTNDFIAVIDALSSDKLVYLTAHDWGSTQPWKFVTEERLRRRIALCTSCSGPRLDHVGHWICARLLWPTPSLLGKMLGQFVRSQYVLLFHLPVVPELSWRP